MKLPNKHWTSLTHADNKATDLDDLFKVKLKVTYHSADLASNQPRRVRPCQFMTYPDIQSLDFFPLKYV